MKILVIQQKMIGDVLTSSILFKALREKYPDAELHYMIYPHTTAVIENNPYIDRLITYPKEKIKGLGDLLKFATNIRKEKYEIVIDAYSKIGSAIISRASGARIRSAYKKWYTRFLYTHTYSYKEEPETAAGLAIENRLLLLQAISEDFPSEIQPKIYLRKEEIEKAKEKLVSSGIILEKPLFMIGVLGSSSVKTYPLGYMAALLDQIVTQYPEAQLLFNYIPNQKEEVQKLLSLCLPKTRQQIHLDIYGESLREFIALTSLCDALIGNEGGAVNMAKAVNTPTFAIFAPQTEKKAWALYEGKLNKAVHLKDFKPKLFEKDIIAKDHVQLYQQFEPELLVPFLREFLANLKN